MKLWEAIAFVVAIDVLAALAMHRIRRRAPAGSYFSDSQRAAGTIAVGGTIFAVLVGFIFLLSFQSYQTARSSAQDEALAALGLFNSAALFPLPLRGQLQADVLCYGRAVAGPDWQAMAEEGASPLVDGWLVRLNRGFDRVHPRSPAQNDAVQNWFDETDALEQGRQGRLAEAKRTIPTTIWVLLLMAGAIVIGFVLLFADSGERLIAQLALALTVTTAVVASLLTVNFLDRPYGDHAGAITPIAMEGALDMMRREQPATMPAYDQRCDGDGHPSSS